MRGAWIEIMIVLSARIRATSLPMRGAWIEMYNSFGGPGKNGVAPHAGSVD